MAIQAHVLSVTFGGQNKYHFLQLYIAGYDGNVQCFLQLFFLAHLVKGHVSFCHHLASVVRRKL